MLYCASMKIIFHLYKNFNRFYFLAGIRIGKYKIFYLKTGFYIIPYMSPSSNVWDYCVVNIRKNMHYFINSDCILKNVDQRAIVHVSVASQMNLFACHKYFANVPLSQFQKKKQILGQYESENKKNEKTLHSISHHGHWTSFG